jgi:hypothetical protein
VFRSFNSRRREIRLHRLRIAMNEVEDAVPPGVHSRDQVRPRDRALRRNARRKQTERPLLCQPGEVAHLPLLDKLLQELRIHAINTEDDQLLVAVPGLGSLAGEQRSDHSQQHQRSQQEAHLFQSITPSAVIEIKAECRRGVIKSVN